jgi:hypothetical protein
MNYEPRDFIDHLRNGTLIRPLSVIGMVKVSDDGNSLLLDLTYHAVPEVDRNSRGDDCEARS